MIISKRLLTTEEMRERLNYMTDRYIQERDKPDNKFEKFLHKLETIIKLFLIALIIFLLVLFVIHIDNITINTDVEITSDTTTTTTIKEKKL